MPTYDYGCTNCGRKFEFNVPIAERDNERECPDCHAPIVRRLTFEGLTWAPTAGGMR